MEDEPRRRGADKLRETAEELSQIGEEAQDTADARRAAVERPTDRAHHVRLVDDLNTAEGQAVIAEQEREAAEELHRNAEAVRQTGEDIRQTRAQLAESAQRVRELADAARIMHGQTRTLRDDVRRAGPSEESIGDPAEDQRAEP